MTHLILGLGEVGKALQNILKCHGKDARDDGEGLNPSYDVLHICFPYSESFNEQVGTYQRRFLPTYTVIHSTVPVGTSALLGALHSPIRGRHPNLEESIKTFVKYVGGPNAAPVVKELKSFGIPAVQVENQDDTEAGKLVDLMQFGDSILLAKEIYEFCKIMGIDFEVAYTRFNRTYNEGYSALGFPQFQRPVLKHIEGKIGGHCVVKMMELLDSKTAKRIINENKEL